MRLTLRTLLAYLDEILDPHDAEQLQRKIQDSEFATALVHQIRGSIRRLRLDAPALDAQGIGGDVNSVAEYLDNTLPPDQVPALEKTCLEHEVHLGEVASCHQILTLVLGEAADINDAMRQRAYGIAPTAPANDASVPTDAAPASVDGAALGVPAAQVGLTTKEAWRAEADQGLQEETLVSGQEPVTPVAAPIQRPDYLENKSATLRSALVTMLIIVLIAVGLLFASGSWSTSRFLAGWRGAPATPEPQAPDTPTLPPTLHPETATDPVDEPADVEVVEPLPPEVTPNRFTDRGPSRFPGEPSQDVIEPPQRSVTNTASDSGTDLVADAAEQSGFPLDLNSTEPPVNASPDGTNSAMTSPPATDAVKRDDMLPPQDVPPPLLDEALPSDIPAPPEKLVETPEVPPAPEPTGLADARAVTDSVPSVSPLAPLVDPDVDLEAADVSPPVASPATVDQPTVDPLDTLPNDVAAPQFVEVSGPAKLRTDQLLLTYDGAQGDWQAAEVSAALPVANYYMCLPALQSDIEWGSSLRCSLVGTTRMQLREDELALRDGRLLLKNRAENRIFGLRFQDERFDIKMAEVEGLVAIEAQHEHLPGADTAELPHSVLRIHAVKQPLVVEVMGRSYALNEGQYLLAVDHYPPRVENAAKSPSWTGVRKSADQETARHWKTQLLAADSIRDWLREQSHRRYNDGSLAARCLAEMDDFGPVVRALQDPNRHAYWHRELDALRRALTRGSETVSKLATELEAVYGAQANFAMEMIRGYSEGQLASGAAAQLVSYLDHPRLDYRVLAIQNLKTITGSTHAFRPEKPVGVNRSSVDRWQKRLRQGHVRYPQSPRIVALLDSFAQ